MHTPLPKKLSSFSKIEIAELFKRTRMRVRFSGIKILVAESKTVHGKLLVVTPRASGSAPERNLFKRRIRAIFRENKLFTHKKDFVVLVNKQGIAVPFERLKELLLSAVSDPLPHTS